MPWKISSRTMTAVAACYFVVFLNFSFWRAVWRRLVVDDVLDAAFAGSLPLVMWLALFVAFEILLWPRVAKPLLACLLVLSAAANYFMYELGVFIDSGMMRNVFRTDLAEAGEMVNVYGILWVFVLGVAPSVLLFFTKIDYRPLKTEVRLRLRAVLAAALVLGVVAAVLHRPYLKKGKDHRVLSKLMNPVNYLVSGSRFVAWWAMHGGEVLVIDPDPTHNPDEDPYPAVLVLVVGETARSVSFSLNGYGRETNPKLSRQDVISFPDVSASATYTDFALPCMFSHLTRKEFDVEAAFNSEGLLDILSRAGYDAFWYDNYGGSKGAADRVYFEDLRETGDAKWRNGDFNYDEVLLDSLRDRMGKIERDTVIVLHTMGSHGPRYYRRYPEAFRVFTPIYETPDVQNHPYEQVVNTYDNTIVYTDHVLSEAIDILKKYPQYESCLLYLSDHGESLGENGLFLHGAPYEVAPREQLQVPFIVWLSETMKRGADVEWAGLRAAAAGMVLSHDNFFHSVLGLAEVETELYRQDLDVFRNHRGEGFVPRRTSR